MFIPAIYICKGNYGLFFKKPKLRDIKTIILCVIGYIIYGAIISIILSRLGHPASADAVLGSGSPLIVIATTLIQLVGEEFFKIFILLIVMYVVYKFTNERDLTIRVGIIITLLIFGLAHIGAYGNILQVLLIQGLGTIFNLYAYMKTKNVVVSYIVHALIDLYGSIPYFIMH